MLIRNEPMRKAEQAIKQSRGLFTPVLEIRRGRQLEENISRARTVLSPRFLFFLSLMKKRHLVK